MFKHVLIVFISILLIDIILHSCAQVGQPVGGPKDTIAPVVLRSEPDSFSVNFDREKILIEFDEFFNLKNINQELVVSPPLEEEVEVINKGKKIVIDLNNELKDSTTYTLHFGNAIQDLHENNPKTNYQYVFSTGSQIDSLRIKGKVVNAFELSPVESTWVMIYKTYRDSTPILEIPDFISKTDMNGRFSINNITSGEYRIFALKPVNSNYLFDSPGEEIAYLDTFIVPSAKQYLHTDTFKIKTDAISTANDTIYRDSLVTYMKNRFFPDSLTLHLFKEDHSRQYLTSFERPIDRKFIFTFGKPVKQLPKMNPVNFTVKDDWSIMEKSANNDTITFWLRDSLNYKVDTLRIELSYEKQDSLDQIVLQTDTIMMKFSPKKEEKKKTKRKKKKKEEEIKDSVPKITYAEIKSNVLKISNLDLGKDITLESVYPLNKFDTTKVHLNEYTTDSTFLPVSFSIDKDTITKRNFIVKTKWKPDTKYLFRLDSMAFLNIYQQYNDTIHKEFTTEKESKYGYLTIDIENVNFPIILYLTDPDIKPLRRYYIEEPSKVTIMYINPGKYRLKLIEDKNANEKWDTGLYLENIQPEGVFIYDTDIEVKDNFYNSFKWNIEK